LVNQYLSMNNTQISKYLTFVSFDKFNLWDTKRYTSSSINSTFPIVNLDECIIEQNKKYKIFEDFEAEFGILGVNNKEGIFDAYTQKGKEINQPYKKMQTGWLAYNPYRINIGSIGIKLDEHQNEYISPAYVVFSCKENLIPDFLFFLFKTSTFNKVINESTTGSVRQNLTFEILKGLQIPLPTIEEQKIIVNNYNAKLKLAQQQEEQINNLEAEIDKYLLDELGVEYKQDNFEERFGAFLRIYKYSEFDKWGADQRNSNKVIFNNSFEVKKIKDICTVSSGGTPSREKKEYYNGDIPWIKTGEVTNEVIYDTEEKITIEAIQNSNAKIYPKDSLIIAMYGQGATRGRTAKLGIDASTNQACAVLTNIDNSVILTDYLWLYLMGEYERMREMASGNNQPNLNAQMIKDYNVIIPSFEIQNKIINRINLLKAKIKELIDSSIANRKSAIIEFEKKIFN